MHKQKNYIFETFINSQENQNPAHNVYQNEKSVFSVCLFSVVVRFTTTRVIYSVFFSLQLKLLELLVDRPSVISGFCLLRQYLTISNHWLFWRAIFETIVSTVYSHSIGYNCRVSTSITKLILVDKFFFCKYLTLSSDGIKQI
jgi:hypothetical protein